jgi:3-methyladenine DNA glycosylase AlkC
VLMPKDIETSSALKNLFDTALLKRISSSIANVYPKFNSKSFLQITSALQKLEMKPRALLIRDQLRKNLPEDYPKALDILLSSLEKDTLSGFDLWPYTEFVQTYGLEHLQISLNALQKMTPRFTAEWAIRPFITKYPKETMKFLLQCSHSRDEHVRRWACEGTRPRLPWGSRLQDFVKDPSPTLPILEELKFDSSLYVRKSVANHLNDIAKDHPAVVIDILQRWKEEAKGDDVAKINWIIHRALRTLIKEGHSKALGLVGVSTAAQVKLSQFSIKKSKVKLGERIEFTFALKSSASKSQKLVVDYIIHFVKSNKKTAPKVFKLKTFELKSKETFVVTKSHHLKKITTREYYSGRHLLEIQVNGKILGKVPWDLRT